MKKYIAILIFLIWTNLTAVKAQLFYDKIFYPGVSSLKTKYYNGSGGGGYWSLKKFDALGRPIEYRSYRKAKLLNITHYVYNVNGDIIYELGSIDNLHPLKLDTISIFEYAYNNKMIISQKHIFKSAKTNSTTTVLLKNNGDSLLNYKVTSLNYRAKTNHTGKFEREYTLLMKNGHLYHLKDYDVNSQQTQVTHWEFYPNGLVRRRTITRKPEDKLGHYIGGPGADDMLYLYSFDKNQRIKSLYYEIKGKKYKIAKYSYK